MAVKKSAVPDVWINVSLTRYPGPDGKPRHVKPGDLIRNAAEDWPPKWVVDAGYIRPAPEEKE